MWETNRTGKYLVEIPGIESLTKKQTHAVNKLLYLPCAFVPISMHVLDIIAQLTLLPRGVSHCSLMMPESTKFTHRHIQASPIHLILPCGYESVQHSLGQPLFLSLPLHQGVVEG